MQLDVLRVTLAVLRVVTLILAHGVIDADGIEPEAVGIIARVIEELTVADLDLDGIRVIIQTGDLDHRDLVERLRAVSRHTGGIAIVAVVRVARADLHFFSLGIRHGVHDRAGGVAGQGDDIKASALEGEGRSGHLNVRTGSVGIDRNLGGAAHGERSAVGIGRVIAIDIAVLALELLEDLLLRRILLAVGRPEAIGPVLIDNIRAIGVRKRGEAVLIVDTRRGDDVDVENARRLRRVTGELDIKRDRRRRIQWLAERIRHRLIGGVDLRRAVSTRVFQHCIAGLKQRHPRDCAGIRNAERAHRDRHRQTEVNDIGLGIRFLQIKVQLECLTVFGNVCRDILINATLVVAGYVQCLDIFGKVHFLADIVHHICFVRQIPGFILILSGPVIHISNSFIVLSLECGCISREWIAILIRHDNLITGNFSLGIVIIIDDIEVCIFRFCFQINQNQLCSVLSRPCDFAGFAVDNRRSTRALIPNHSLVIPCSTGIELLLFPSDGIIGIPHVLLKVFIALTISDRNFGYFIVTVVLRGNDANVSAGPVAKNRCGLFVHIPLSGRNCISRVNYSNSQSRLSIAARFVRCLISCTIAPVLNVGVKLIRNRCFLKVIGYQLITGAEIVPDAVRSHILPRALMVTNMRQSSPIGRTVTFAALLLDDTLIQPHRLPIIYFCCGLFRNVIRCIGRKGTNFNAICCCGCCFLDRCFYGRVLIVCSMRLCICDPILEVDGIVRQCVARHIIVNNNVVPRPANLNVRCPNILTSNFYRAYIDRALFQFIYRSAQCVGAFGFVSQRSVSKHTCIRIKFNANTLSPFRAGYPLPIITHIDVFPII